LARVGRGKINIKPGNNYAFEGEERIDFEDEDETLHFFFPEDYAYAVADSLTDFSNRANLTRFFYSDRGKHYLLAGVPWNWINTAPAGALIIDPLATVTNSDDTWLQDAGNYGSGTSLVIGKPSGGNKRRTIIPGLPKALAGQANSTSRAYQPAPPCSTPAAPGAPSATWIYSIPAIAAARKLTAGSRRTSCWWTGMKCRRRATFG
jgi:hypothetical protein